MPTILQAGPDDPASKLAASTADIIACPGEQARAVHDEGLAASRVAVSIGPSTDKNATLAAITEVGPWGVILSGFENGADIVRLSAQLAVAEAIGGRDEGITRIIAVLDTPAALTDVSSIRDATSRLAGLAWDAQELARHIGAEAARYPNGRLSPPCLHARGLCLFAATAAGVPAFDTACDRGESFASEASEAHFEGFAGKIALNDTQIRIVNEIFGGNA